MQNTTHLSISRNTQELEMDFRSFYFASRLLSHLQGIFNGGSRDKSRKRAFPAKNLNVKLQLLYLCICIPESKQRTTIRYVHVDTCCDSI